MSKQKRAAVNESGVVEVDKSILIFADGMILHPWGSLARDIRTALVEHRQGRKRTTKVCGSCARTRMRTR